MYTFDDEIVTLAELKITGLLCTMLLLRNLPSPNPSPQSPIVQVESIDGHKSGFSSKAHLSFVTSVKNRVPRTRHTFGCVCVCVCVSSLGG